jgi:hypothetical protein
MPAGQISLAFGQFRNDFASTQCVQSQERCNLNSQNNVPPTPLGPLLRLENGLPQDRVLPWAGGSSTGILTLLIVGDHSRASTSLE